ncbi:MAG: transposase [Bacteroidia bacterium]|nr:transposase [Bacteroidia bacterium]
MFKCQGCGFHTGRDFNAALSLKNWAVSSTASACGVSKASKP